VADSYFASVQAPIIWLYGIGLRFIGTVKTATKELPKEFPMGYLGRCVINEGVEIAVLCCRRRPMTSAP
jgi:hypothetical protein